MRINKIVICIFTAIVCSCSNTDIIPTPAADLTQRMGRGELFDKLITIQGISDIKAVNNINHSNAFDEEYQFYVEQYIDPDNHSAGTFKQKARIGHYNFNQPMVLVTEGYSLEDKDSSKICNTENYEELVDKEEYLQGEEIARHLKANMLSVEHRYFYTSNPDVRDWTYLTSKNASSDLHHVYETLQTIYTKSWISTGSSKGGMTTMFYHFMYPDDVDICVPYVTPMCYGLNDDRARDFILELAGTPELRAQILECKNWLIKYLCDSHKSKLIFDEYRKQWQMPEVTDAEILKHLQELIIRFDVEMWNYDNDWAFEIMPIVSEEYQTPEWIVNWFAKIQLTLDYKYWNTFTQSHKMIIDPVFFANAADTKATFYDVNIESKTIDKELPYTYMSARELGNPLCYSVKGLNIPDNNDWQSIKDYADSLQTEESLILIEGFDKTCIPQYSPELYNACVDYYQKNDDRVIFIYGGVDLWTGCGINDVWKEIRSDRQKYPTFGFDSKKQMSYHIAKDKGHDALISDLEPEEAQMVWDKIEQWVKR